MNQQSSRPALPTTCSQGGQGSRRECTNAVSGDDLCLSTNPVPAIRVHGGRNLEPGGPLLGIGCWRFWQTRAQVSPEDISPLAHRKQIAVIPSAPAGRRAHDRLESRSPRPLRTGIDPAGRRTLPKSSSAIGQHTSSSRMVNAFEPRQWPVGARLPSIARRAARRHPPIQPTPGRADGARATGRQHYGLEIPDPEDLTDGIQRATRRGQWRSICGPVRLPSIRRDLVIATWRLVSSCTMTSFSGVRSEELPVFRL